MNGKILRYLEILELKPGATYEDVRKAYRELVLIWHPDKVPSQVKERASDKFKQINEAYSWISDNPSILEQDLSQYRRETTGAATAWAKTQDTPVVLKGFFTDRDKGLYVYPDLDTERLVNFVSRIPLHREFSGYAPRVEDILVFYDIDGAGEEGMAITRTHHLVNNNVIALFQIPELDDVKLEDAMLFWRQVSVRKKGDVSFQLAGYTSKQAGLVFTEILQRMLRK